MAGASIGIKIFAKEEIENLLKGYLAIKIHLKIWAKWKRRLEIMLERLDEQ